MSRAIGGRGTYRMPQDTVDAADIEALTQALREAGVSMAEFGERVRALKTEYARALLRTGELRVPLGGGAEIYTEPRRGLYQYAWPSTASLPDGTAEVARKYTRQPGPSEQFVRWQFFGGPEPDFPACNRDDCT